MNQEETFSSSTTAPGDLPEECSPQCCNGPAASRDEIARILREASETDLNPSRRFVSRRVLANDLDAQKTLRLLNAWSCGNAQHGAWVEEAAAYISPGPGPCSCCKAPSCTGARIIFAMLSLSALEETARFLSKSGICDADLPFQVCGKRLKTRWNDDKSCRLLDEMQMWTMEKKRMFCHFQWAILTPLFERKAPSDIEIEKFPMEVCLPWLEDEKDPWNLFENIGGSYTSRYKQEQTIIRKIKISRQCHNLETTNEYFALKSSPEKRFLKEVKANKRIEASHSNVVPLLAAFQHAGLNYMLFPWAESGSLDLFWEEYPKPPERDASKNPPWRTSSWLWEQCSGLASALSFIHGYSNPDGGAKPQWHADIHPKNVLCFRTPDREGKTSYTLRISDFEFAEAHASPTAEVFVMLPPIHPVYYPPELRTGDEKARVTFKRDVWSLGCVYLELLSWFALGYEDGIEGFISDREVPVRVPGEICDMTFFRQVLTEVPAEAPSFWARIFGSSREVTVITSTEVSPPVREKISFLKEWWRQEKKQKLAENGIWGCESLVEELVGFIEHHMLVVDVDRRATSDFVHGFFID